MRSWNRLVLGRGFISAGYCELLHSHARRLPAVISGSVSCGLKEIAYIRLLSPVYLGTRNVIAWTEFGSD